MAQDYTNIQLEEMVVGKQHKANAVFYEKARLMIDKSKEAGRRIYEPQTYIMLTQPGVTDKISYAATKKDIEAYPEEYAYYMQNRQGVRETVPISIIPNLNLAHYQELIDLGLSDVRILAETASVPPHLEPARQSAITLHRVLQEQRHASKKENIEEEVVEEVQRLSDVLETHRLEHPVDERRREVPGVQPGESGEPAQRHDEGGREQRHQLLNPVSMDTCNWKVDMVWRN